MYKGGLSFKLMDFLVEGTLRNKIKIQCMVERLLGMTKGVQRKMKRLLFQSSIWIEEVMPKIFAFFFNKYWEILIHGN